MSKAIIGALRVSLGLDSAEFTKGLANAKRAMGGFEKKMHNIGGKIAGVGAAISVAGAGIALAIKGQIDAADELSKASQKFGVPIETLSKLKYAADLSDVSLESLGKSFGILSKTMVAASNGNKAAAENFNAIGVAVTDATGKLRPSEAVMSDIADVLAKMPDGAEKTALALSLFGDSGADMIPLLNGGGLAIREMMAEAEKLGLVISEKTGKDAEAFNDNLTRLGAAIKGLAVEVTAALLPVMVALSEKAVELAKWFGDLSPEMQKTLAVVSGLVVVAGPLLVALGAIVASVGTLTGAFAGLAAVTLANPIIALIAAVAAGAALIYMNWDGIVAYFTDLWAKVSTAATEAWAAIKSAWSGVVQYFSDLIFVQLPQVFDDAWAAIKEKMLGWVEDFKNLGWNLMEGLKTGILGNSDGTEIIMYDAMGNVIGAAEEAAEVQSPSRVFQRIGAFLMEGLGIGIRENAPLATDAMGQVVNKISGSTGSLSSGLENFRSSAESAFTGLVTGALSFNEALGQVLSSLAEILAKSAFGDLFGTGDGAGLIGKLFGFANGTPSAPGGLSMVGERGPELVNLPRGAQVFTAQETRSMVGGGNPVALHFAIDARYATEGTAQMIARTLQSQTPEIIRQAVTAVGSARRRGYAV